MNSLNSILIEGTLSANPQMSYTPKGTAICTFTIESVRSYREDEEIKKEVCLFDVSCQTRLAEVCGEYLKKGRGVRVVGRLTQITPETKGVAEAHIVKKTIVLAEHVEFEPQDSKQPYTKVNEKRTGKA